jgi:hypothetical protein
MLFEKSASQVNVPPVLLLTFVAVIRPKQALHFCLPVGRPIPFQTPQESGHGPPLHSHRYRADSASVIVDLHERFHRHRHRSLREHLCLQARSGRAEEKGEEPGEEGTKEGWDAIRFSLQML